MVTEELDAIFEGMFEAIIATAIGQVKFKQDIAQLKKQAYEYYRTAKNSQPPQCPLSFPVG